MEDNQILYFTLANRNIKHFDIHFQSSNSNKDAMHCHEDFYELVLFGQGSAWDEYCGEKNMLTQGEFFIYAPGTVHRYSLMRDIQYYNVLFSPEVLDLPLINLRSLPEIQRLLPEYGKRSDLMYLSNADLITALHIADEAHKEAVQKKFGWHENLFSYFIQLLLFLVRHAENKVLIKNNSLPMKISKAIKFMGAHVTEDHSLEKLAKTVAMSKSSFRHQFKTITGFSPIQYLIRLRLRHALQLLCLGKNITTVAMESGFHEVDYFNRMFKKHLGISPHNINLTGSCWEEKLKKFTSLLWK